MNMHSLTITRDGTFLYLWRRFYGFLEGELPVSSNGKSSNGGTAACFESASEVLLLLSLSLSYLSALAI